MHAFLILSMLSYRVWSAIINSTVYRKETVVVCGIEEDTPMFGTVSEVIVTTHQECFFAISPLITIAFQHHFHASKVVPTDSTVVYCHRQLFDYHPLVCTKAIARRSSLFISMKYH